jgi:hypothetical protein
MREEEGCPHVMARFKRNSEEVRRHYLNRGKTSRGAPSAPSWPYIKQVLPVSSLLEFVSGRQQVNSVCTHSFSKDPGHL